MMLLLVSFVAFVAVVSAGDFTPSQVHLALAGVDSTGIAVSYQTAKATTTSTVKFGKSSSIYTDIIQGTRSIYYETVHHHIVLTALAPSTKYYYVVGDDAGGWSSELHFTSPATSSLRGNFSFLVFADLGTVNGGPSNEMIKSLKV